MIVLLIVVFVYSLPIRQKRRKGLPNKKSEALGLGLALMVHAGHECLEVGCFVFCDGWLIVDVVILEYLREHVGNSLALWVAHGIDSSVGTFSHELMLQAVAVSVATDDATHFPEAEVVEEVAARNAYLAHE